MLKTIYTEYDPLVGVHRDVQTDGRNMREVTRTDPGATRATLDRLQTLRSDDAYAKQGIKEGWHHAATIPMEVVVEWMNQGFDVFTAHPSEILKRLRNRDYEKLRATAGRI